MWMRTILDNSDKRKKRKRKVKIKMRELKNGGKEKNQGKIGLGLGNLGIYNFLLSSNFPLSHFLFRYSLIDIYIYIYSLSQIRLSALLFLKKRLSAKGCVLVQLININLINQ